VLVDDYNDNFGCTSGKSKRAFKSSVSLLTSHTRHTQHVQIKRLIHVLLCWLGHTNQTKTSRVSFKAVYQTLFNAICKSSSTHFFSILTIYNHIDISHQYNEIWLRVACLSLSVELSKQHTQTHEETETNTGVDRVFQCVSKKKKTKGFGWNLCLSFLFFFDLFERIFFFYLKFLSTSLSLSLCSIFFSVFYFYFSNNFLAYIWCFSSPPFGYMFSWCFIPLTGMSLFLRSD